MTKRTSLQVDLKNRSQSIAQLKSEASVRIRDLQKQLSNVQQNDNFTPVHYACHRGNLPILKLLLQYDGDIHSTSKNGVNSLHLACVSGNLDLIKYLILDQRLDPFIKSTASESQPVHLATNAGHINVVEYLISEHRCDPLDEDKNSENCLTLAIKNRKREMALWLLKTDRFQLN